MQVNGYLRVAAEYPSAYMSMHTAKVDSHTNHLGKTVFTIYSGGGEQQESNREWEGIYTVERNLLINPQGNIAGNSPAQPVGRRCCCTGTGPSVRIGHPSVKQAIMLLLCHTTHHMRSRAVAYIREGSRREGGKEGLAIAVGRRIALLRVAVSGA